MAQGEAIYPIETTDLRTVDVEKDGPRQALATSDPASLLVAQQTLNELRKIRMLLEIVFDTEIGDVE